MDYWQPKWFLDWSTYNRYTGVSKGTLGLKHPVAARRRKLRSYEGGGGFHNAAPPSLPPSTED